MIDWLSLRVDGNMTDTPMYLHNSIVLGLLGEIKPGSTNIYWSGSWIVSY